jgi:hypothetical protein
VIRKCTLYLTDPDEHNRLKCQKQIIYKKNLRSSLLCRCQIIKEVRHEKEKVRRKARKATGGFHREPDGRIEQSFGSKLGRD